MACRGNRAMRKGMVADVPPQLGHISAALRIEHQVRGALGVRPLAEVLAVGTEDLDAVALAVAHEDAPIGGARNAMRQIKLPRSASRLAPRVLQLPGRRKAVHARIAVTIRNVVIAVGADRDIGGAIERPRPRA